MVAERWKLLDSSKRFTGPSVQLAWGQTSLPGKKTWKLKTTAGGQSARPGTRGILKASDFVLLQGQLVR